MFCPSCGARNPSTALACAECHRALPAARAPAAVTGLHGGLAEPAATTPDRPSAAPAEAPRILRRPAPLSPAPVDVVPKNPSPPPPPPPKATTEVIDPDGPTLIRRQSPRWSESFTDVTQPLPRSETPAHVEGVGTRAPAPVARPAPAAPAARTAPAAPQAPVARPAPAPAPASPPAVAARPAPAPAAPVRPAPAPPAPPPRVATEMVQPDAIVEEELEPVPAPAPPSASMPTMPLVDLVALEASRDLTGATAELAVPAAPAAVLVLGSGWRLALARLVDAALSLALAGAALFGALTVLGVRFAVQPLVDYLHQSPMPAAAVLLGTPFAVFALYQALSVLVLRGTFGCRLAGLRVVALADGSRPGLVRSIVRGVAAAAGALLFGSGPLWGIFVDRRRRGLGDIVARSVVVRAGRGPDGGAAA